MPKDYLLVIKSILIKLQLQMRQTREKYPASHVFAYYRIVLVKYSPIEHCVEKGSVFATGVPIHLRPTLHLERCSSVFTCQVNWQDCCGTMLNMM